MESDLFATAEKQGLQAEAGFFSSVLNLNELITNRHGIMIIGDPMAGKTKSLRLIESTINSLYRKEFKLQQAEFLRRKALIYATEGDGDTARGSQQSHQEDFDHQPNPKLSLTDAETLMVTKSCRHKAISMQTINPKAQSLEGLMGEVDAVTREFKEGILTTTMRNSIKHGDNKATWVVFDGDIEMEWVENLNSVLDDNRKLTLITGESLPLTKLTRIIIESNNLHNCSPATVSRCGIIFMNDKLVSEKAIFNHYVRNFPPILSDLAPKFDQLVNLFFPDILDQFLKGDSCTQIDPNSMQSSL